jgi:hypothetical protein
LEPGDGGHRGMPREPQRQAVESNEVGPSGSTAEWARLGSRVSWWGACGWGRACHLPSGQIPPPWARWENEAPATRAASSSAQAGHSGADFAA